MPRVRVIVAIVAAATACLASAPLSCGRPLQRDQAFIGYSETSDGRLDAGDIVALTTPFGKINLRLKKQAPLVSGLLKQIALQDTPGLNFYRHEKVPDNWGVDGFYGPPYALLQGTLGAGAAFPAESMVPIKRGDVCNIPNTREFFIATAEHTEWGHVHPVFAG